MATKSDIQDIEKKLNELNEKFQSLGGEIDREMGKTLNDYRETMGEKSKEVYNTAKDKGKQANEYVHDHPWQSAGIAFGIGMLIGCLMHKE